MTVSKQSYSKDTFLKIGLTLFLDELQVVLVLTAE